MKYDIIKFYQNVSKGAEIIKTVNSLKEAQKICQDPKTECKKGLWFYGFKKVRTINEQF